MVLGGIWTVLVLGGIWTVLIIAKSPFSNIIIISEDNKFSFGIIIFFFYKKSIFDYSFNINLNNFQDKINIISNPLFDRIGFNEFKYGGNDEGGALSAFGVNFGHDGRQINNKTSSNVLGFSLDWMLENDVIEIPNLIKLDVDGIEHIILQGAQKVLTHPNCKSILVEVDDSFSEQSETVSELLTSYGYILRDKLHGKSTENSKLFSTSYNQIWVKNYQ